MSIYAFRDLLWSLDVLPLDAKPKAILATILAWLRSNLEVLDSKPFAAYSFHKTIELNEDEYPVEYSQLRGDEFFYWRRNLHRYRYQDRKSIAMLLSGALERLIYLEVERICPYCGVMDFIVHKNLIDGRLVYECTRTHNMLGVVTDTVKVVPATTLDLKKAGLI